MEQVIDRIRPEAKSRLLTVEDVARILDVHASAVDVLVDMKLLPFVNISPRFERRFLEDDVRFLVLK